MPSSALLSVRATVLIGALCLLGSSACGPMGRADASEGGDSKDDEEEIATPVVTARVARGEITAGRYELPLAIARHAFSEDKIGVVSPVIETPQGFCLISVYRVERGASRINDVVELFQAPFYTAEAEEFGAWLKARQAEVADRVTYVHPDYRDAMPPWLSLPDPERD